MASDVDRWRKFELIRAAARADLVASAALVKQLSQSTADLVKQLSQSAAECSAGDPTADELFYDAVRDQQFFIGDSFDYKVGVRGLEERTNEEQFFVEGRGPDERLEDSHGESLGTLFAVGGHVAEGRVPVERFKDSTGESLGTTCGQAAGAASVSACELGFSVVGAGVDFAGVCVTCGCSKHYDEHYDRHCFCDACWSCWWVYPPAVSGLGCDAKVDFTGAVAC